MTKGFNPVTNTANGIANLVAARLADDAFKANNAFDAQTVDVLIGASGTFNASQPLRLRRPLAEDHQRRVVRRRRRRADRFRRVGHQPGQRPAAEGAGHRPDLPDQQRRPGRPRSAGRQRLLRGHHLGSEHPLQGPVRGSRTVRAAPVPPGKWDFFNAPDAAGRQAGFQGAGYYVWGPELGSAVNSPTASSALTYTIFIPEGQGGTYQLRVRSSRDAAGHNDVWVKIDGNAETLQLNPANTVNSGPYVRLLWRAGRHLGVRPDARRGRRRGLPGGVQTRRGRAHDHLRRTLGRLPPRLLGAVQGQRSGSERLQLAIPARGSARAADLNGARSIGPRGAYSTVTDFARLRGWSTSVPLSTAVW